MKLYDELPSSIVYKGKKIKLDLDFRNVLKMIDIYKRDDLMPEARDWNAMRCVCKHPVKGMETEVKNLLFPKTDGEIHQRITDYEQDSELIISAFRQAYGIDLFRDKLHWFEFMCLLSCIPSGSRYSDILSIRARPLPQPTKYNSEERQWLIRAKAENAIKLTEREQEDIYKKSVESIGQSLIALSRKGK